MLCNVVSASDVCLLYEVDVCALMVFCSFPQLILDQVLGLTLSCNAAFCCDPVSGTFAYPTG